jgi:hypothetical protein
MPRGQYPRKEIPVHHFSITVHQADWPRVLKGAKAKKMSVASFMRWCVFKRLGVQEHDRQQDRA